MLAITKVTCIQFVFAFLEQKPTSRPSSPSTRSTVACRMSRPVAVTSSASGCAKKRDARKPRHPYMLLAVSFSACCRVSYCCRRSCGGSRVTADRQQALANV